MDFKKCGDSCSCPSSHLFDLITCYMCSLQFHTKCYGINKAHSKLISDIPNVAFFCDECLHEITIKKNNTFKEITSSIAELKKVVMEVQTQMLACNKPTFSDVVTGSLSSSSDNNVIESVIQNDSRSRPIKRKRIDPSTRSFSNNSRNHNYNLRFGTNVAATNLT